VRAGFIHNPKCLEGGALGPALPERLEEEVEKEEKNRRVLVLETTNDRRPACWLQHITLRDRRSPSKQALGVSLARLSTADG
jgi:hypothetical protein